MKTVFILDQPYQEVIFSVLEGDYRHLDRVYIGGQKSKKLQDELCECIFIDKDDCIFVNWNKKFPLDDVINGAFVIVVGFVE